MTGALKRATALTPQGGSSIKIAPLGGGQLPRVHFASGASRAMAQLSQSFEGIAGVMNDQLDAEAAAQGQFQGSIDGATGDLNLQTWGTIRGNAYNKAAADAFVNTIETQTMQNIARIRSQHAADPVGMEKALTSYTDGVAAKIGEKFPPAMAAYRKRAMARALPAIEQANENRFRQTRDRAEATSIQRDMVVNAEIKSVSTGLFSNNPRISQAAAVTLQGLREDHLRFYKQTDAGGRPLFSPKEIAKADQDFYSRVMTSGVKSWFAQQPDKAQAYLKLTAGGFKINMDMSGDVSPPPGGKEARGARNNNPGNIEFGSFSKARGAVGSDGRFAKFKSPSQGIQAMGDLLGIYQSQHGLSTIAQMIDRWAPPTENDTGAYAARVARAVGVSVSDPIDLRNEPDKFAKMVAAMIEHENGYQVYSENYVSRSLQSDGPIDPIKPSQQTVDLGKLINQKTLDGLESDFRTQIAFENSQEDRNLRIEEKAIKAAQEAADGELYLRLAGAAEGEVDEATGKPLVAPTMLEVQRLMRDEKISAAAGKGLIKAMQSDEVIRSDPAVQNEILERIYRGEDVKELIFENMGSNLKPSDARTLLAENKRNTSDEKMTDNEKFYFKELSGITDGRGLLDKFDSNKAIRAFNAKDEFRKRISEDEPPEVVARDLMQRFTDASQIQMGTAITKLILPRFHVKKEGVSNRIDLDASKDALQAAFEAKLIKEDAFLREAALLKQWFEAQEAEEQARAQAQAQKGAK